jgi:cysteine desulfurase/selenocysteine lyase
MEHHSNIVPWHFLRERCGAVIKWVPVTDEGALDVEAYERLFTSRTKFVSLVHMSNVLGTLNDAARLAEIAHAHGVPILFDGTQAAVHAPVDVSALGCDFYAFTGHKLYGPNGAGVLYAAGDHLDRMQPYQGGGEMIAEVTKDAVVYADAPHKFEAGTPAIADVIGLGAAIDWVQGLDRPGVHAHEISLLDRATAGVGEIDGVRIFGSTQDKGAILSFTIDGAHPHDLAQLMDKYGVAVRAGHHCAHPLMQRYGVPGTVRASFAAYNTVEEVDAFLEALHKARTFLI